MKTRLKRPRKRGYRATGVRDVLLACKDVHLDKQGVTVDWNTLIKNYDYELELTADGMPPEDTNDSDDESETGSMDGLGTLNKHLGSCNCFRNLRHSNFTHEIKLSLLDDDFSGILNITDHEVTPHKDYVTIGLVGEY